MSSAREHETRDQSTGGTCTWALQLNNGCYVYDLDGKTSGYSLADAQVWFSQERAEAVAKQTAWLYDGARAVRSRP